MNSKISLLFQIHSLNGASYPVSGQWSNSTVSGDGQFFTEQPPARSPDIPLSEEIRTEYAEITFTTESAILSTVYNVK